MDPQHHVGVCEFRTERAGPGNEAMSVGRCRPVQSEPRRMDSLYLMTLESCVAVLELRKLGPP